MIRARAGGEPTGEKPVIKRLKNKKQASKAWSGQAIHRLEKKRFDRSQSRSLPARRAQAIDSPNDQAVDRATKMSAVFSAERLVAMGSCGPWMLPLATAREIYTSHRMPRSMRLLVTRCGCAFRDRETCAGQALPVRSSRFSFAAPPALWAPFLKRLGLAGCALTAQVLRGQWRWAIPGPRGLASRTKSLSRWCVFLRICGTAKELLLKCWAALATRALIRRQ